MKKSFIALLALTAAARALTVPVAEDTVSGSTGKIAASSGRGATLPVNAKQTALVRFETNDLNIVPFPIQPQNVNSAKLRLYVVSSNVLSAKLTNAAVTVHTVITEWHETFTGAPIALPAISATPVATIPAAELVAKRYITVDITAAFADALKTGSTFGYALKTTDPKAKITFASKEGAATGYSAEIEVVAGVGVKESGENIFIGNSAGESNTSGEGNTFLGNFAGQSNVGGTHNSFIGYRAGVFNTEGFENTFVGVAAGSNNINGGRNTFIGMAAGELNTTGNANSIFGAFAGRHNTSGGFNSFFGEGAGESNTTGGSNVFIGGDSGKFNTTGRRNVMIGTNSGKYSTVENDNTLIGAFTTADYGITNATAIGSNAEVFKSNSVILGNDCDVGIRNTAPNSTLQVSGSLSLPVRVAINQPIASFGERDYVLVLGGSLATSVILPQPGIAGRVYVLKNRTTQTVSITFLTTGPKIDGLSSLAVSPNAVVQLICDGAEWYKIN